MSIRRSPKPNSIGVPKVDFIKNNFDVAIFDKGYDVIVYDAVQCPCVSNRTSNLSGCQNCLGLGWIFINPIETKAILTSINRDTKYKFWSPEFKGTIAATLRDIDRLSFMDKIVLKDKTSIMSEVLAVKEANGQKFVFTSYPVSKIKSMFIFDGENNPLIRILSIDFDISDDNPYVIKLLASISLPVEFNGVVSIDYEHKLQYNVVDIPHDIRVSTKIDNNGRNQSVDLPIQCIAQKSHYVTGDSPKYDGAGIQDNSFL